VAGDGDVISVHEEVANAIFPTIAQHRAAWAEEQGGIPAGSAEGSPAVSFDDWA
jgi:hypothetical protein